MRYGQHMKSTRPGVPWLTMTIFKKGFNVKQRVLLTAVLLLPVLLRFAGTLDVMEATHIEPPIHGIGVHGEHLGALVVETHLSDASAAELMAAAIALQPRSTIHFYQLAQDCFLNNWKRENTSVLVCPRRWGHLEAPRRRRY